MKGVDFASVQKLMGHADIKTTWTFSLLLIKIKHLGEKFHRIQDFV